MVHAELLLRFGIALLVGASIGLEREFARLKEGVRAFAGVRTFPLIALLGCSAALLSEEVGGWAFGALLIFVGLLIAIAYGLDAFQGRVGVTSEVAATVVFVCGALCYYDYLGLAAAMCGNAPHCSFGGFPCAVTTMQSC